MFVYYDIVSTIKQEELTSKGYVNAKFAVPSGAGSNVHLYFITDGGTLEEIAATISEDGSAMEAQITKLGTYAACRVLEGASDIKVESIPDKKEDELADNEIMPCKSSLNWLWIVVAGLEFIIITGYIGYFIWKRNSKK